MECKHKVIKSMYRCTYQSLLLCCQWDLAVFRLYTSFTHLNNTKCYFFKNFVGQHPVNHGLWKTSEHPYEVARWGFKRGGSDWIETEQLWGNAPKCEGTNGSDLWKQPPNSS